MGPRRVEDAALHVIQAAKLEPRIMRYELSDFRLASIRLWLRVNEFAP
jgi:hypothetical protein